MKAVVLEKNGNEAVILKEDGTIDKINRACEVGEEIIVNDTAKIVKFTKKYVAIAACFVAAIILGVSGYAYAAPTSYVTMDANLSFEFALNVFDEVVSMTALSEEGEQIAEDYNNLSSFHPTIDEAVSLTCELLYNANYLDSGSTSDIVVSAVSNDDKKSIVLSGKVETAITEVGNKYGAVSDISTAIGTTQTRDLAASEGKSTGQYIKDNSKNAKKPTDGVVISDNTNSTSTAETSSAISGTTDDPIVIDADVPDEDAVISDSSSKKSNSDEIADKSKNADYDDCEIADGGKKAAITEDSDDADVATDEVSEEISEVTEAE